MWVELPGYKRQATYLRLDPFELEAIRFDLLPDLPVSPGKVAGHAAFWTGVGAVGFGFVSLGRALVEADAYRRTLSSAAREYAREWTGGMWAGFGAGLALMTTGVVLWVLSPERQELWDRAYGGGVSPTADGGAVVAYRGRF